MAKLTRYLVVKVQMEVDIDSTDQTLSEHEDEITDFVSNELDYSVQFDGMVEAGDSSDNAIEVPVKITKTEVLALLNDNPV